MSVVVSALVFLCFCMLVCSCICACMRTRVYVSVCLCVSVFLCFFCVCGYVCAYACVRACANALKRLVLITRLVVASYRNCVRYVHQLSEHAGKHLLIQHILLPLELIKATPRAHVGRGLCWKAAFSHCRPGESRA